MPVDASEMPRSIISGADERPDMPPDDDSDLGGAESAIQAMLDGDDEAVDEAQDEQPEDQAEEDAEAEDEADDEPEQQPKKKQAAPEAKAKKAAPDPSMMDDAEYLAAADIASMDDEPSDKGDERGEPKKKGEADDADDEFSVIEPRLLERIGKDYEGDLADGFKQLTENASKHIKALRAEYQGKVSAIEKQLALYQRREILGSLNEIRDFAEQTFKSYPKAREVLGGMNPSKATPAQAKAMRTMIAQAVGLQRHAENHPENPRSISLSKALEHVFRRDYAKIVSEADAQRKAAEKPMGGRNVRLASGKQARTTRTDRTGDGDDGTRSAVAEIAQKFGLPVR